MTRSKSAGLVTIILICGTEFETNWAGEAAAMPSRIFSAMGLMVSAVAAGMKLAGKNG